MIDKNSTMQQVLDEFPSAQQALFVRYHIGGCHSCGYDPADTLEKVCASHDGLDVGEVIAHIQQAAEAAREVEIAPQDVAAMLKNGGGIRLLDVRSQEEWELAHIEGATLVTPELAQQILTWPKETPIVLHCHHGVRSLDAASYLIGQGFTSVKSMSGGIEAWSLDIDPAVPRY